MATHFSTPPQYYERVFEWVLDAQTMHKAASDAPFFVCVNGPQGSGKSTLTSELVERGEEMGVSMLAISIDDFYLSRDQQQTLAEEKPNNRFWQQRGYPGTHDVELGAETLRALREQRSEVLIPRYDKSAFSGLGDRKPESQWSKVNAKSLKVVFLEGWMLGFLPLAEAVLSAELDGQNLRPDDKEAMNSVNKALRDYSPWLEAMDAFIRLKITDFSWVVNWRAEAEENMKASGKPGMTAEQVIAYAESFLPAYQLYSDSLSVFASSFEETLILNLGHNRLPEIF